MLLAAALVTCLAPEFETRLLDIQVAVPITVVRGEPARLDVTLTYRGDRPVPVSLADFQYPCAYWPPPAWKRLPPAIPVEPRSAFFGSPVVDLRPGRVISHAIVVGETHSSDAPPGVYSVRLQARLAVVAFAPPRAGGQAPCSS